MPGSSQCAQREAAGQALGVRQSGHGRAPPDGRGGSRCLRQVVRRREAGTQKALCEAGCGSRTALRLQ